MPAFVGRVALVTGAGAGIGREIARRLALEGARVVLNDVDAGLAERAAAEIAGEAGLVRGLGGDVADVEVVRGLVARAVEQFGRLDLAVANAGLTLYGDFLEYEPARFDRLMAVNLRGSYFTAQAAARQMRAQGGGGRILLLSSVTGHRALRQLSAYGMTKAALEMMARALVVELSPFGIAINAIAPGATVTPRTVADPEWEAGWARSIPLGRPATVSEVAGAALFLLSEEAAQVTGQTLIVDGGWTSLGAAPPERA
jgi:NAD(P)-dependent dehydrogenase (short-subunit alcohol dehydrogenase family)